MALTLVVSRYAPYNPPGITLRLWILSSTPCISDNRLIFSAQMSEELDILYLLRKHSRVSVIDGFSKRDCLENLH